MPNQYTALPQVERFWATVAKAGENDCWHWTASKYLPPNKPMGRAYFDNRTQPAHRVAYELSIGPIPAKHFVTNNCGSPDCCNPAHLKIVTVSEVRTIGEWLNRTCKTCGKAYQRRVSEIRKNDDSYCSRDCYFKSRQPDLEAKFWSHVEKSDNCWLWIGSKHVFGYGQLWTKTRSWGHFTAHRYSYELHKGTIPAGLEVLHNCPSGDNPSCVNPAHLWIGTQTDNIADMYRKGRGKFQKNARAHRE